MWGIILASASSAFQEITYSIGKRQVEVGRASLYTFGFLSYLTGTLFILSEGLWNHHLFFSSASLPTFTIRVVLEVLLAYITIHAIVAAERGDFGFVKTLTVPLLLSVDMALGYFVSVRQIIGISIICAAILVLILLKREHIKGFWYLILSAVIAVATLSLYKYDITHFNSVEAEQSILGCILLIFFFCMAAFEYQENPLLFLKRPLFVAQSLAGGLDVLASSFAYFFAPASVILTASRSASVLFAILTGRFYFKEEHFLLRIALFIVILGGLVLLIP
jgi:drug/metabolite transporter (DMT)-like permease